MLALHQAEEIRKSITAYLKATFDFRDPAIKTAFDGFLKHPKEGIFKGPFVSLKLPFVKVDQAAHDKIPLEIKRKWMPYDHQMKSWYRLSTQDNHVPISTIVTTGTGSGKTEAFLFPLLDYCYKNKERRGIKAIILYPMNALATDQAKRLAEEINNDPKLKGNITACLFIGLGKDNKKFSSVMGADHIIENRNEILDSPPDILLTNFKMLDYGLMRSNFQRLWRHNIADIDLMQFLVLDELHTYDGAQGTDVAHLIRRLKLKLNLKKGSLCAVGTSATIGSGAEAPKLLSEYASKLFGEDIKEDAIILENRVSIESFFEEDREKEKKWYDKRPSLTDLKNSFKAFNISYQAYTEHQYKSWGLDPQIAPHELSEKLINLTWVKDLLEITSNGIISFDRLVKQMNLKNEEFRILPEWDEMGFNPKHELLLSLFTMIANAKADEKQRTPFLQLQIQLWIRDFTGVLRLVDDNIKFTWSADENEEGTIGLPPYYCRECGATGWLMTKADNEGKFGIDAKTVYQKFFEKNKDLYIVNNADKTAIEEYRSDDSIENIHISKGSLHYSDESNEQSINVNAYRKINESNKTDHTCPECNTRNTVSIIGTRIPTLTSIAVSQNLSTNLSLISDKERKVLAFTNSVQDAAHQASFIEARNYRFTFRSSLQKVVNAQNEETRLDELGEKFIKYWKQSFIDSGPQVDGYYYRFFPSDYLGKYAPKNFKKKNDYESNFKTEFDLRMTWQVISEFGHRSRLGRTLEKTSSSGVAFDAKRIEKVFDNLNPWMAENNLSGFKKEDFLKFVNLLLHRIRIKGGINHAFLEKLRSDKLQMVSLDWFKDKRHFLNPTYYPNKRLPKIISIERDKTGLTDSTYTQSRNWFHAYFIKHHQLVTSDLINEFYVQLLKSLSSEKIMDEQYINGTPNYAIDPSSILVSKMVSVFQCKKCGQQEYAASSDNLIENGICLSYRCQGQYEKKITSDQSNYYQEVYNREKAPRIYGAEHTGLLERKARELLEIDFKKRESFDSINAMVATSTLEMGIDIGSLNTAINNSIPPTPSNFLQRIGRAGRSSGNALILNFAKGEPHDLFYYKDPMEMMEGDVSTPGCFIQAKEILKRHFFAYCLDCWSADDVDKNSIPVRLQFLHLSSLDVNAPEFFISRIIKFIEDNFSFLLDRFHAMYKDDLEDAHFDFLTDEFDTGRHDVFLRDMFLKIKEYREHIFQKQNEIQELIKENKYAENDPELISLNNEKRNLSRLWTTIEKRMVLEHMTNSGALPNYAFPETGVTMNGLVYPQNNEEEIQSESKFEVEIVRPASQALKELAPDNKFYTQGYAFEISGLDVYSWSDGDNLMDYRFCSRCDMITVDSNDLEDIPCPKCGDRSFGAASNTHKFASLKNVKSINQKAKAIIKDSRDERETEQYHKSRHFKFDEAIGKGAWILKEVSFGIEYVNEVEIFDANLGRMSFASASKTTINNHEVPVAGFVTCKHCGKSSSKFSNSDYVFHYGYCKHKAEVFAGSSTEVFEQVYLKRSFKTEILKILIPPSEFLISTDILIFKAGLELGLRKYFKGNPSHIQLTDYEEYNEKAGRFDHFVVLFDTIPGGSSYLENIFSTEKLSEILTLAYNEIRICSCQYEEKDGCYRCIYSYGNKYNQKELSRERAEKLFEKIIDQLDGWDYDIEGLSSIIETGRREESLLEEKFIYWLKHLAKESEVINFEEEKIYDRIRYKLGLDENGKKLDFTIEPQVSLGPRDGVGIHTKPDFMITLNSDDETIPEIAIYLDGYTYHATKKHQRFEGDINKRMSIINGAKPRLCWTITWSDFDIHLKETALGDEIWKEHDEDIFKATKQALKKAGGDSYFDELKDNLSRLMFVLRNMDQAENCSNKMGSFLSIFQKTLFAPSYATNELQNVVNFAEELVRDEIWIKDPKSLLTGSTLFQGKTSNSIFELRCFIDQKEQLSNAGFKLSEIKGDLDKGDWEYFWRIFNLLQFGPLFIADQALVSDAVSEIDSEKALLEFLELYEEKYHKVIRHFSDAKEIVVSSETEIELTSLCDDAGEEIAGANLIVKKKKIVFNPYSEESAIVFKENGYQVFDVENYKIN